MKKSFCIFSAQYLPHMGGVEQYTDHLAAELCSRGHKVVIVTSSSEGLPPHTENENGLEIIRLDSLSLVDGRLPITRSNRAVKEALRDLSLRSFDLVLVNTRFYKLSRIGARFAHKNRIPLVVIEHGSKHLSLGGRFLSACVARYEHFTTKKLLRYSPSFYGVSPAACRWLEHFGIISSGLLHNSVDPKQISEVIQQDGQSFREEHGISPNTFVAVFAGRFVEEKGIRDLLSAMDYLKDRSDIVLFLAGDGPLRSLVESAAEKLPSIICLGQLEHDRVLRLFNEADAFCLPSYSEGLSTTILEAVACSCLIVSTEASVPRELLPDNHSVSIIPQKDPVTLAETMLRLAETTEAERAEITSQNYSRLLSDFTWEKTATEVERLISDSSAP